MDTLQFNNLLLKTAFSCMACDGDIDKREVKLIKHLQKESKIFGEVDINAKLDTFILAINKDGRQFMSDYFTELATAELVEARELKLIEVAIDTIKADEKVEYNEIKFFKVIRSKLKIGDESILEKHPDFEYYLEQDIITNSYLLRLQEDFFDTYILNEFELTTKIDDEILNNLIEKN